MNALMRSSRGVRGAVALGLGLAVLGRCGPDARASAIRRHGATPSAAHRATAPVAEVAVFRSWSRYLLAGPMVWTRVEHPTWDQTVRTAVWASIRTAPGPSDPMVNFLLWKQSLDPTRFAHYHPALAPALHRIAMTRRSSTNVATGSPTPTSSGTGTPTQPQTLSGTPTSSQDNLLPPAVPEPGMLLIASAMTAWALRRALRGRAARAAPSDALVRRPRRMVD